MASEGERTSDRDFSLKFLVLSGLEVNGIKEQVNVMRKLSLIENTSDKTR